MRRHAQLHSGCIQANEKKEKHLPHDYAVATRLKIDLHIINMHVYAHILAAKPNELAEEKNKIQIKTIHKTNPNLREIEKKHSNKADCNEEIYCKNGAGRLFSPLLLLLSVAV